jgi:hypothetical protein
MRRACRSSAVRCRSTALRVGSRGCRAAACAWIRFAVFDDRLRCGCPRIDRLKVPVDSPTVLALARRRGAFWLDTTGTQLGRADLPGADQQEAGPRSTGASSRRAAFRGARVTTLPPAMMQQHTCAPTTSGPLRRSKVLRQVVRGRSGLVALGEVDRRLQDDLAVVFDPRDLSLDSAIDLLTAGRRPD